jgi:hypothetical protein
LSFLVLHHIRFPPNFLWSRPSSWESFSLEKKSKFNKTTWLGLNKTSVSDQNREAIGVECARWNAAVERVGVVT